MFCRDYPRSVVNCRWLWWFPALDPLPVAPALPVALLSARLGLPVSLLRLPARPLPRRLPPRRAEIALPRLPRTEALLASLQQTSPPPRPACRPLPPPSPLIFGMGCSTLERAHGR